MHIRSSLARGMHVVDDSTQQTVGLLDGPLIDPDTGKILGFFVTPVFLGEHTAFLQVSDIASFGTRVHIISEDRLGPPDGFVRLLPRLKDTRAFLGQTIRVRTTGRALGTLEDVQFSTRHFVLEWLFPRKWLFVRQPFPASDILEVTNEAIWVKDPLRLSSERMKQKETKGLAAITDVLPQVQTRK